MGDGLTMKWHGALAELTEKEVWVTGYGRAGKSVVAALQRLGARVVVIDENEMDTPSDVPIERTIPEQIDAQLIVTSPGWRPGHEIFRAAARSGVKVIGDIEFAWWVDQERARVEHRAPPKWLAVTGTNGKTTTVGMLESMLIADGLRAIACGNVGLPVIDAVMAEEPYDVLAVEFSSFEIHWSQNSKPFATVLLNIAEDHLDWHGSYADYAETKVQLLARSRYSIYNADDENTFAALAGVSTGERISFTLETPRPGQLGVVEEFLVDRAFVDNPNVEAGPMATLADVKPFAPHNVANALAAASLARAAGVSLEAISRGLNQFQSGGHRIEQIGRIENVDYVDDSKATNPHAAAASLRSFPSIVWIAGGLAKGASMERLVVENAKRLRGAVLIGQDRGLIRESLEKYAPEVTIIDIEINDVALSKKDRAIILMDRVVETAAGLSAPGDTVLLAPACASMDQFESYAERGELFSQAVAKLPGVHT
jgi:UDP-N-acetylmuramoylalanine--D-glutamate ligase